MSLSRRRFLGAGVLVATGLVPVGACSRAEEAAPTGRFPGDPGKERLYYGASLPASRSLSDWEAWLESPLSVHRSYFRAEEVGQLARRCEQDLSMRRLPHLSIKPPRPWAEVASGHHDWWVNQILQSLAPLKRPVLLTVHHEPENEVAGEGMQARDFVAMQEHIIDRAKSSAPNVTVVPVLQSWSLRPRSGRDISDWVVDAAAVFGVDLYNPWSATNGKRWVPFAESLDRVLEVSADKPIAIGEYGCRSDPSQPRRAEEWMRSAFDYARAHDVVSMSYFNSYQNSPEGSWELGAGTEVVFRELLHHDAIARAGALTTSG